MVCLGLFMLIIIVYDLEFRFVIYSLLGLEGLNFSFVGLFSVFVKMVVYWMDLGELFLVLMSGVKVFLYWLF